MLTRIYHKKDEQFNVEFFQDKECRQAFNFENVENLYIELKEGDITPLSYIFYSNFTGTVFVSYFNDSSSIENFSLIRHMGCNTNIKFITIENDIFQAIIENCKNVNLVNLSPNLSKYIPTDNAILFLNKDDADKYADKCEAWFLYQLNFPRRELNSQMDIRDYKKITIFIESYTESEIKKTIDIAKKLKEKYGIEEVNLFILHCFVDLRPCYLPQISYLNDVLTYHFFEVLTHSKQERILAWEENGEELKNDFYFGYINTITTTNSTKIACIQEDSYYEHRSKLKNKLNILDCYDIFNDWLKRE